MFSRARRDGYYVSYGPSTSRAKYVCTRVPDVVYSIPSPPSGRTATSVRQTCAACGRFRSARWEAAHPLSPGMAATSSICARCQHDHTSSEEREPRPRRRRMNHHRHSRHCTDRTDESYCSLKDRRSPRRYRTDSRDYSRPKTSSRDNVRIVIANQPGERPKPRPRRSSSIEGIRVIRRTSVVEVPERVRPQSRMRSSSRAYYLDDGTAQYVEDLSRPRYRSQSRSLSQASYVEEFAPPISRHKHRSSSRVQFVDDLDEPVLVPRPRRISRRRAIYFDGPASLETPKSEERGRSRPRSSHHEAEGLTAGVQLTEETDTPHYRPLSQAKTPNSDNERVEEKPSPHRRLGSESTNAVSAIYGRWHGPRDEARAADLEHGHSRQRSGFGTNDASSDQDKTPRPVFRSTSASQVAGNARTPSGHKRTYSRSADSGYKGRPFALRNNSTGPSAEGLFDEPATPQNKRRRIYRDDSTNDDHRPVTPMSFHHVPPSPPDPHSQSDYLSEMLKSSHITPPGEQIGRPSRWGYARGPPSPPQSRGTPESEDSAYCPPFYRDATVGGTEHWPVNDQYSPVEDLYGNKIASYGYAPAEDLYGNKIGDSGYVPAEGQYEEAWPYSTTAAEYDWM